MVKKHSVKTPTALIETIKMLRSSGMMQVSDMARRPAVVIASMMRKPSGRKSAGMKGRPK